MPHKKNYLDVNRETEKEFYRICRDLSLTGKSIIETHDNNTDRWCNVSRKIGVRGKPLIDREEPLLLPPLRSRNIRHRDIGVIITAPNVQVIEEQRGKKSRFRFFKNK